MSAGEVEGRITRRTTNAWGIAPDVVDRRHQLHLPDFLAFIALAFPTIVVPGLGLPANEIVPGLLCVLVLLRAPAVPVKPPWWFVALVLAIPTWLALVSYAHGLDPVRRMSHTVLYAVLALFLASGRIHLPSAARGLGVGLLASVVLTVGGVAPQTYPGRLSGFLGDPNLAGYLLAVLGGLALGAGPLLLRRVLLVVLPVAVVLTESRTTLLAMAFAVVWVVAGRRVNVWLGIGLVAVYAYVVAAIPRGTEVLGVFSDRTGSDALRGRLLAQEKIDVATSPWFGAGAGTARVNLGTNEFFYHSSYLAAQREGGWVLVGLLTTLGLLVLVTLIRRPVHMRNGYVEAGVISLAVVAVNLGEVLLELPAAIILGAGMHLVLTARESPPTPRPRGRARVAARRRRAVTARHPATAPAAGRPVSRRLTVATNHGDVGGGEVMLLTLAGAARRLGWEVTVVGPERPGELVDRARRDGFGVVALAAHDRATYARALRAWDHRRREGLLWCNGLLPALATTAHRDRVVHLHREPDRAQRAAALVATRGARAVVVPSASMGRRVPHATVLPNWTGPLEARPPRAVPAAPTVGFLGRLTVDKGVHLLARAVRRLRADGTDVRLLLAGDARFGTTEDEQVVGAALAPLGAAVERTGWVAREEFFDRVDCAAFPSTWAEPFGLVAAEAMGCGVPFVVSDAGALPEVAGPAHPWVAARDDPEDLARVLARLLGAGDSTRAAAVAAARRRWEELFSPAAGQARLAALLADL